MSSWESAFHRPGRLVEVHNITKYRLQGVDGIEMQLEFFRAVASISFTTKSEVDRIGQGNGQPTSVVVPQQGSIDEPVEHLQEALRPTADYVGSVMRILQPRVRALRCMMKSGNPATTHDLAGRAG